MANDLTIQKNGTVPKRTEADIARAKKHAAEITQGISQPFGRVTYKQGKWGLKVQGQNKPLYRLETDPATNQTVRRIEENLDIIIAEVAEHTVKVFYEGAYRDGDTNSPDCCSSDGIKHDAGVPKPQVAEGVACAACKWNRWGSRRASDDRPASRGKECADYKKMVVLPVHDIENKVDGGPLLLQVPPSSLKAYKGYVDKLAEVGFLPSEVWTRVSFVEDTSYPLFDFDCPGVLSAEQKALLAKTVKEHAGLIERIINSAPATDGWDEPAAEQTAQAPVTGDGKANGKDPEPVEEAQPDAPPPPPGLTAEEWSVILQNRKAAEPEPPPPPPPGISPEEWAIILKRRATTAQPEKPAPKKTGAKRTATVSPEPHDSGSDTRSASPKPTNPAPATTPGNGAAPDVTARIAAMVDKLV
jgi:hypothetical protein